jgi:hypothetical protein
MNELEQEQQVITEYLLGGLDEETKQQVEERVITDRKYKEEVLMVEDELVEDYLAGRLPETKRDRFRRHYLSGPSQRQKLRLLYPREAEGMVSRTAKYLQVAKSFSSVFLCNHGDRNPSRRLMARISSVAHGLRTNTSTTRTGAAECSV